MKIKISKEEALGAGSGATIGSALTGPVISALAAPGTTGAASLTSGIAAVGAGTMATGLGVVSAIPIAAAASGLLAVKVGEEIWRHHGKAIRRETKRATKRTEKFVKHAQRNIERETERAAKHTHKFAKHAERNIKRWVKKSGLFGR